MLTEKDLIFKLQKLNSIKPRQEWVSLVKSQIINPKLQTNPKLQIPIFNFLFQRKFAYAFATLLIVVLGTLGFAQYGRTPLTQFVQVQEAKQSASEITKILKSNLKSNSIKASEVQKIKKLKTLAGLSATVEMKNLDNALKVLVENEIADLEKATLTEEQQKTLKEIKELYNKTDYTTALEKILTF